MTLLQPTNSECFALKLPVVRGASHHMNESVRNKLGLEYRTGAAVTITRSNVYVHGGLTLPLNLHQVNSLKLQKELILYFAKHKSKDGISFQNLDQYISSEVFSLDLISRTWMHIPATVDEDSLPKSNPLPNIETDEEPVGISPTSTPRSSVVSTSPRNPLLCPLKERSFHSICFFDTSLYIFGGLIVSPQNGYELIATNELWKMDLKGSKPAKWTLISDDIRIARRFNHSMHVKNEHSDTRDTKLVIVGGLNNLNEPINTVDIYNITKGCWENDIMSLTSLKLNANIDNYPVSLTNDNNFSILVENNEAKIPALVFYTPNCQNTTDRTIQETKRDDLSDGHEYYNEEVEKDRIGKIISPITALPLMSNSEGMRMAYNGFQKKEYLVDPFNLTSPTGDYFGYNIILGGFYPDRGAKNFKCYIFDIPSGKWTRVGIKCIDPQQVEHRFWRVFVWKSHHQAFFLGTKKNDGYLPSVQRFDYILTFGLSMLNAFNKTFPTLLDTPVSIKQHDLSASVLQNNLNDIFKQQLILDSDQKVKDGRDNEKTDGSTSTAAPTQFEKYIRYIAPSVELTNVRSVFPPYAMVLGKDALEIFGKSLADFEFITSEGDSIGIPLYLLRSRWGRYFDLLLAKSYTKVVSDYEQSGAQSSLVKTSPRSSRAGSAEFGGDKYGSSICSFSNFFSKHGSGAGTIDSGNSFSYAPSSILEANDDNSTFSADLKGSDPSYQSKNLFTSVPSTSKEDTSVSNPQLEIPRRFSNVSFRVDDEDESIPPHAIPKNNMVKFNNKEAKKSSNDLKRTHTSASTTSSSGGLVFRVPFQEKSTTTDSSPEYDIYVDKSLDPKSQQKRRSSLMALTPADKQKINYPWKSDFGSRRSSHPTIPFRKNDLLISQNSHHPSSRFGSSARSSISYVSSMSDRMGNSSRNNSRSNSGHNSITDLHIPGILNVIIPPQKDFPNETLPTPKVSSKHSSLYEYELSNKSSPLSSRRPSYFKGTNIQDLKLSSDVVQNSLDKQLLDNSTDTDSRVSSISKGKLGNYSSRANDATSYGHFRKSSISNEKQRLSVISSTDSVDSHGSTFPVKLEPLMIPRSLYMPWPTLTVRAFSEFFYTGQVSSKWSLAPVVLDLLIMSKIYEIPLLYSLVAEVLYSLIGKKEEGLYVVCNAARLSFRDKVRDHFGGNKDKANNYLNDCVHYKELVRIKEALEGIEDGFLDVDLLAKASRSYSMSSKGSSSEGEGHNRISSLKSDLSGPLSNFFRTMYDTSPRESLGSIGSFGATSNPLFEQRKSTSLLSSKFKKKSSLSREIGASVFDEGPEYNRGDDLVYNTPNIEFRKPVHREESPCGGISTTNQPNKKDSISPVDPLDIISSDETSTSSSTSSLDSLDEQSNARTWLPELSQNNNIYPERTTENSSKASLREKSFRETRGDSLPNLESSLGVLSLKKMKKKVKKGEDYFDDSIDPLMKISNALNSPSKNRRNSSKVSGGGSIAGISTGKSHKDGITPGNMNSLTLESMLAHASPPPVDYVIKSIYRTAVLVNDSRLTIRCLDCLELSSCLRKSKKGIKSIDISTIT